MKPSWAFPALLMAILAGAPGIRAEAGTSAEELFKWGEYDSLIHILEPARLAAAGDSLLAGLASRDDSAAEAKARMYLGVAYWAKGRTEDGLQAFTRAAGLDGTLRLDPLYATPEMAARFEAIAKASRPPAPSAPDSAGTGIVAPTGPGNVAARRSPGRTAKWMLLAGTAVAGAAAGTYLLVRSQERPRETITLIKPD